MNSVFLFSIAAPDGIVLEKNIKRATLLLESGYYTFMADHDNFIGFLQEGTVEIIDENDKTLSVMVSQGVAEIHENRLILLAENASPGKELSGIAVDN